MTSKPYIPKWMRLGAIAGSGLRATAPATPSWLLLKPGSLGDVLLFTGPLRVIRERYPEHVLTLVTDRRGEPILRRSPYYDQLIVIDDLVGGTGIAGRWRRLANAAKMFRRRYEGILCPFYTRGETWAFGALMLASGNRKFYVHDEQLPQPFRLPADFTRLNIAVQTHELDRMIQIVRGMGCKSVKERTDIWPEPSITREEEQWAAQEVAAASSDIDSALVVSVCAGARFKQKCWEADRYADLLSRTLAILRKRGQSMVVLLLGGHEDWDVGEQIIKSLRQADGDTLELQNGQRGLRFANLAGACSLHKSMALINRSDLCVGNDTFGLHAAITVGTPSLVVMWGGSGDQWIPWGDRKKHRMVRADVDCGGCAGKCSQRSFVCMERITVDMAMSELEPLLTRCGNRCND